MPDKDLILDWIRHATNDLLVARNSFENMHPKQTEIAAYLSQQCAEKALKAFLVYNNIDPPKIHNLKKLCYLCSNVDTDFAQLEIYCDRLDPFTSTVRYPNELVTDDAIARMALEDAQRVYDFCTAKINLKSP